MAIEAPISKFKKTNLKIFIAVCILAAVIFAYDGYLSQYEWSHRQSFFQEHVKDGQPDDTMKFNRIAPVALGLLAILLAVQFFVIKDKKIIADENELVLSEKKKIAYESIQKIDKTHFNKKGFFVITYTEENNECQQKLSDRKYDNLDKVLEHLVAKIS